MASTSMPVEGGAARGKMEGLQDQLEAFIEHLRVVGVIAGDFQQNGQIVLNDKL